MSFDVFISYSSKDSAAAKAACAALEAGKIRCWIAPRDILPSASWGASIVRAINECRVMVLIFSGNANASAQVHREVDRAFSKGKAVVPLRIEDIKPADELAYYLDTVHWLDALTPPLERNLDKLVATVRALLPTMEPVPAEGGPATDDTAAAQAQDEARAADERRLQDADTAMSVDGEVEAKRRIQEAVRRQREEAETNERQVGEAAKQRAAAESDPRVAPAKTAHDGLQSRKARRLWAPSRRSVLIGGGIGAVAVGGGAALVAVSTPTGDQSIRTFEIEGHPKDGGSSIDVAIARDGRTAVSASGVNYGIELWDLSSGAQIRAIRAIPGDPRRTPSGLYESPDSVAIASDGHTALVGSYYSLVRVDLDSGDIVGTYRSTGFAGGSPIAVSADNRIALSATRYDDKRDARKYDIVLWDVTDGKVIRTLEGHASPIKCVAIAPDGRTAISSDSENFKLWDLASGATIRTIANSGFIGHPVAYTPDSGTGLLGLYVMGLGLWDLASGEMQSFTGRTDLFALFGNRTHDISCIAVAPDGHSALTGDQHTGQQYNNSLTLWELPSGRVRRTFTGHRMGVTSVAIAADGRTALSASYDGTVKLWDLTS